MHSQNQKVFFFLFSIFKKKKQLNNKIQKIKK